MIETVTDLRTLTAMLKSAAGIEDDGEDRAPDEGGPGGPDWTPDVEVLIKGFRPTRLRPDAPLTTAYIPGVTDYMIAEPRISIRPPGGGPPSPPAEDAPEPPPPPPLEVLKQALRVAIRLEFATVPPYLTALWSIIDQAHPVAKTIRAIAHEEMLHVAILCNFLSALGERPVLTGEVVPRYPCQLPGDVHRGLTIELVGYDQRAIRMFMEIERPEDPFPIDGEETQYPPPETVTIGEFYAAILLLFDKIGPALDPRHQIAGPFSWFVLTEATDVHEAITLIMTQGEGSRGKPYVRSPRALAHYYRFKSLFLSVELEWDEASKTLKRGKSIVQPSVFTLAPASARGYTLAAPQRLREANDRFEASYSQMLRLLEEAWKDGGHKSFIAALEHMFELTHLAQTMMRIGTPDGRGYCPAFLYRP